MKTIRVEPYREETAGEWDDLVDRSVNGTIFHRRRFLAYHPPGRFEDHSLWLMEGGRPAAVFPAAAVVRDGRRVLRSHPGASYGGLVVPAPPGAARAIDLVKAVVDHARAAGFDAIEFRMAPKIYRRRACDELDYAWWHAGFRIESVELSTFFDCRRIDPRDGESILSTFSPSCRRSTRKASAAGLATRFCTREAEFRTYWEILASNLEKHGATPTHSLEEILDLRERFPGEIRLLGVFRGGEMLAGIVPFVAGARVVHVFYFASRPETQALRPLNLGVLRLIRFAAEEGTDFVNFGISTEDGGRRANLGLFRFKEGFGGSGIVRTFWRMDLAAAAREAYR